MEGGVEEGTNREKEESEGCWRVGKKDGGGEE